MQVLLISNYDLIYFLDVYFWEYGEIYPLA